MHEIATMSSPLGFLSNKELRLIAPSLFAHEAAPGASERYQFVRTADVIDTLREIGYEPVKAGQRSKSRNTDGADYVKHVVRLMHKDFLKPEARQRGDVVPQIILTNSHNRTSAFHLSAGLFRLLCSNGLAVSVADFAGFRVLHNDVNIHDHIIDGANLVREISDDVITPQVEAMTRKVLSKAMVRDFAEAATFLKWGEVRGDHVEPFLVAQRQEDEGNTLWNVLNRVQENAVRGGYDTVNSIGRNVKARPIANIARDLDFNVGLWQLGAKVLELA